MPEYQAFLAVDSQNRPLWMPWSYPLVPWLSPVTDPEEYRQRQIGLGATLGPDGLNGEAPVPIAGFVSATVTITPEIA